MTTQVRDLTEHATICTHGNCLTLIARTYTALLLATEWNVVIKDIVLIDPDLSDLSKFC
jgi:hypothetical protein